MPLNKNITQSNVSSHATRKFNDEREKEEEEVGTKMCCCCLLLLWFFFSSSFFSFGCSTQGPSVSYIGYIIYIFLCDIIIHIWPCNMRDGRQCVRPSGFFHKYFSWTIFVSLCFRWRWRVGYMALRPHVIIQHRVYIDVCCPIPMHWHIATAKPFTQLRSHSLSVYLHVCPSTRRVYVNSWMHIY